MKSSRFEMAIVGFDAYNSRDPNRDDGTSMPKELLYAKRMTEKLLEYVPDASKELQLAARCQHIGRWEIPRNSYPMDRKGYLKWRTVLKLHHATLAERVLTRWQLEMETIEKVKSLIMKKELNRDADAQALEDVVCLVFLEYYFDEFAAKYADEKLIDILQKTIRKMSVRAIEFSNSLKLSDRTKQLIYVAAQG